MRIKEFLKRYQIVLFLSFLVVALVIIKVTTKKESPTNQSVITTTPTPTMILPTPTPTREEMEESQDIDFNYPLERILPYKTDDFIIEKYVAEQVLKVKAISENKIKIIEEINKWIASYDLEPGSHKIVWE